MRCLLAACLFFGIIIAACGGSSGLRLRNLPNATYTQIECLDVNGDHRLNVQDAADPARLPKLDSIAAAGGTAAFLAGIDIPLDAAKEDTACHGKNPDWGAEFVVARGELPVNCDGAAAPVLLVGVGGGVSNLERKNEAAGVTQTIDSLQAAFQRDGVPTFAVISGQALIAASNVHTAMEDWMTHAVGVYMVAYPCLRVALVGHSHGAITVDVMGSRLESTFADRILSVVDIDRVEALYHGDLQSWPSSVPVLNIFESNDPALAGAPRSAANVENWDASGEQAPAHGRSGWPGEAGEPHDDRQLTLRDAAHR